MMPRQPCSLSSSCQAQLAVLAHSTGVLHSYDHACSAYLLLLYHGVDTGLRSLVLLAVQRTSSYAWFPDCDLRRAKLASLS